MTPSQMLAKVQEAKATSVASPHIWVPPERKILTPNEVSKQYAAETLSLLQNICPMCGEQVEVQPPKDDKKIRFQCTGGSPYHYFVRDV